MYNFIYLIILILFIEFIFLKVYLRTFGINYKYIKRVSFKKFVVDTHPYLPFILKKNFKVFKKEKIENYFHKNFYTSELTTNNLGLLNGKNGDKFIKVPKPKNLYRINCLGASTTANYINYKNKNYSYPLELEKILKKNSKKKIEVNNFGQGGYNSADLLVRFCLQLIDTKPDMVIFYHAYNDIRSYLTKGFKSDYSHSRRNFGEVLWRFRIGSFIPNLPLNFFNYFINKILPSNHRYSLLDSISKGNFNIKLDYRKGLLTFERNIQSIIDLCKSNKFKLILCTYCFFLHEKIKNNPTHKIFYKILKEENKIIKKLAKKNSILLVDCESLIPKDDKYFVDSIHFSPDGMKLLAKVLSERIKV